MTGATGPRPVFGARFVVPVLIGPTLNPINSTMIAVALVPIAAALRIGSGQVIWLVAILYLVAAISQPTMGTLADLFGPKRIYRIGMAITVVAGVVPLLSHTFPAALLARVLIGIGTSSAYPSAMALIRERSDAAGTAVPPALLSALSIASLVTTAVGPVLGGVLIAAFGWETVFAVNVPLGGLALVLASAWLPSDRGRPRRARSVAQSIDFAGMALFAIAIASLLVLLLSPVPSHWWLGVVFVAAAVGLVLWERRRRSAPFIDVRLLARNGALARTYVRLLVTFTGLYLFVNAVSQWLQDPYGLTAAQAGLLQIPIALVAGAASLVVARSTRIRLPLLVAAIAPVVTGLVFAFITTGSPLWLVLAGVAAIGVPQGLGSLANQAALYRQSPPEVIGNAAGLSRTSIYLGAIVSSSIIGILFGPAPTTAGMEAVGWILLGLSVVATVLTVADRSLAARPAS